uniref:Uncharacterized protein n=1 Tax=Molossus molossus TaxID=27622 RepID=A0A7J8F9D6_MOLMO|nr:hypothetical protein HJG59_008604 [Molossus molossus]
MGPLLSNSAGCKNPAEGPHGTWKVSIHRAPGGAGPGREGGNRGSALGNRGPGAPPWTSMPSDGAGRTKGIVPPTLRSSKRVICWDPSLLFCRRICTECHGEVRIANTRRASAPERSSTQRTQRTQRTASPRGKHISRAPRRGGVRPAPGPRGSL